MKSAELRAKFLAFFEKHKHTIVPSSSLLPTDPSVLFTTAGMQQFKPYYLGEESPYGKSVTSCQKCIRTSDIEEVGDERHLTFFEMLGNFSFGGYFKEEAIALAYEFITRELELEIDYVTVFEGSHGVDFDQESYEIWKKLGVPEGKIKKSGIEDNFWGPTGNGGPCGPTTEIYVNGMEIWNIVFNEFYFPGSREELLAGNSGKELEKLKTPGVDTGMGLERLVMVKQNVPTVFETDLFIDLIRIIPDSFDQKKKRIIADHCKAIAFLVSDGVLPSNKNQGYILRRLMRRIMMHELVEFKKIFEALSHQYSELDFKKIWPVFEAEARAFKVSLQEGLKQLEKMTSPGAKEIFSLYETFGLPVDILRDKVPSFNQGEFDEQLKKHQELSRTSSAGMFKGGLADHDPKTVKLHTAHHLLLAALQEKFGGEVKQRGSNINQERLRIDFSFDRKLTDDEKKEIEARVQSKIDEGLNVVKREMPLDEAQKIGAQMEFGVKYGNTVSVYFIEDKNGGVFSKEFCGGPHVQNTAELGKFKIAKEEAVSAGVRRIKAILE
jgi:alanyl-tRNA synthetase